MIKIAFFDIDGTLMELDGTGISDSVRQTLKDLQNNGIRIVAATGRLAGSLPDFRDVVFDAYITFNGSYCYTENTCIYQTVFRKEDVQTVFANAGRYQLPIVAAAEKNHYYSGYDSYLSPYYAPQGDLIEAIPEEDVYQFMVSCRSPDYQVILNNTTHANVTDWQGHTADIYPADSGKDVGVQKVLDHFGFTKEEAIVFGDGNNDLSMFRVVGTSVAMGNAADALKKAATHICPRVEEDGVSVFCRKYGLL